MPTAGFSDNLSNSIQSFRWITDLVFDLNQKEERNTANRAELVFHSAGSQDPDPALQKRFGNASNRRTKQIHNSDENLSTSALISL